MKKFFEAEIEVVKFNVNDVITTSTETTTTTEETLPLDDNDMGWG